MVALLRLCKSAIVLLMGLAPHFANAHGLLLDADSDGTSIVGSAYYSNGDKAANELVALLDLSVADAAPVNATTDDEGNFSFQAVPSHRYSVTVYGDEGHSVTVELVASGDAKPKLIDSDVTKTSSYWPPPAWAILLAALLLSLIPVFVSRKRAEESDLR